MKTYIPNWNTENGKVRRKSMLCIQLLHFFLPRQAWWDWSSARLCACKLCLWAQSVRWLHWIMHGWVCGWWVSRVRLKDRKSIAWRSGPRQPLPYLPAHTSTFINRSQKNSTDHTTAWNYFKMRLDSCPSAVWTVVRVVPVDKCLLLLALYAGDKIWRHIEGLSSSHHSSFKKTLWFM